MNFCPFGERMKEERLSETKECCLFRAVMHCANTENPDKGIATCAADKDM